MQRAIKFRAWDNQREIMFENPFYFEPALKEGEYKFAETWQDWEDGRMRQGYLLQYTGLKDKNGVEIYEGDILGVRGKDNIKGAMEWDGERGEWAKFHPLDRFEVIGNIYANPELLQP